LLETTHRLRRNAPLRRSESREAEAQKLPFPWLCHRALLFVHLELELRRDESPDALHHSFPRPPATNVDVAIVRVPYESETSPLQLPVEFVEHDITEQGRQWTT